MTDIREHVEGMPAAPAPVAPPPPSWLLGEIRTQARAERLAEAFERRRTAGMLRNPVEEVREIARLVRYNEAERLLRRAHRLAWPGGCREGKSCDTCAALRSAAEASSMSGGRAVAVVLLIEIAVIVVVGAVFAYATLNGGGQ